MARNVISHIVVDLVGMDVNIKLADSRSNRSWDIRAAHFVMDDE